MSRALIYNFSGELDEVAHLFPSERLARMAAILKAAGHHVLIEDCANFRDLRRFGKEFIRELGNLSYDATSPLYAAGLQAEASRIAAEGYDCVFMNLWHGCGFKFCVDLAGELRRMRPALRIYGVGQKVDWFAGHILELAGDRFDGLVSGLGYNAIAPLAAGKAPGDVSNMIVREAGQIRATPREVIHVDDYPAPLYAEDVYRNLDAKIPIYSLTLSNQACPNQCAFCVRPENYGRVVRQRQVAGVLEEARALYHRRGVTHFRLEDSTPPRMALTEFAAAVESSDLRGRIRLSAFSRVDSNSGEDFRLIRKAGFLSLFFGLESFDDTNLVRLCKGTTYAGIRDTLTRAHAAGLFTVGCFIFPTPGETRESRDTTLARILELKPVLDSVLVVPAGIYPPTAWGRDPDKYGIRLAADYVRQAMIYQIKFEVPLEHWRPFPFSYRLFDREPADVTFADIVAAHKEFVLKVKNEFGIPRVPDYYLLLADWTKRSPPELARDMVGCLMQRDYAGLARLFPGMPQEEVRHEDVCDAGGFQGGNR
jgi:radical SAM superfamily enzyme YgiQ (UPF0313 family)